MSAWMCGPLSLSVGRRSALTALCPWFMNASLTVPLYSHAISTSSFSCFIFLGVLFFMYCFV